MKLATVKIEGRYQATKHRDKLLRAIVWKLPRRLVMWSAIRVMAHATTGPWSSQIVPDLTAIDALKRWDGESGGSQS